MQWVCLDDRHRLSREQGKLVCAKCGRAYDTVGEIPVFTRDERESERVRRPRPLLDELWALMQELSSEEAADRFCATHGCSRRTRGADWRFFLPAPPDGRILEIGAGFGDPSVRLPAAGARTTSIVPSATQARILERHLRETQRGDRSIAVMAGLGRLPFEDRSVGAIAMEDTATAGFDLSGRNFDGVAAEWRRVLAADGAIFLGLANRLDRLSGRRLVQATLRSRVHPESLDRLLRRSAAGSAGAGLGLRRTLRSMARHGFRDSLIYAPLPDERTSEIVIPVQDANVVRYFLENLVRKNSALVRAALKVADLTVRLDLFRCFVPFYFLIFRSGQVDRSARDTA